MNKMTTNQCIFYIVRHGETDWNARGVIQGHVDTPLNEAGKKQALDLAEKFRQISFDRIFSSDLERAVKTAEFIKLERNLIIKTTQLLREKKFGAIEGKAVNELDKLDAIIASLSEEEKFSYKPEENVESDAEVIGRVGTFLQEIALQSQGETILIVTHGAIIRTLLIHLGYFTYEYSRSYLIGNTAYVKLTANGNDFFIEETQGIKKKSLMESKN
jgi:broad specificity phosphatase PhoE